MLDDVILPHIVVGRIAVAVCLDAGGSHLNPAVSEVEVLGSGSAFTEVEIIPLTQGACSVGGQVVTP